MDTELINGFGDVMQHIRNQEQKIKDLEKENKRLNNEIIWEWSEQVIGLKETIQELKQQKEDIHKQYKEKINQLIEQKQELESKVDEAQVAFEENKIYKKEIDTLRESVENECEASGIMQVMNMRIEDAENKAREQEVLKVIAEKECAKEVREKMELHSEVHKLHNTLEKFGYSYCSGCGEYNKDEEMETVIDEYSYAEDVCLKCRDEHHTQCDECMEYHCNTRMSTIGDREVCSGCLTDEDA